MVKYILDKPMSFRGGVRRHLTGQQWTPANNADLEFSLEKDWLTVLDIHSAAQKVQVRPFSVGVNVDGVRRRYVPDVLVEWLMPCGGHRTAVYEVKPSEELRANWGSYKPLFKQALRHCLSKGWSFKILSERDIRTPYLSNANFLRRYKVLKPQVLVGKQLIYTLKALGPTTPQALLAASYLYQETRLKALPELWRLISIGDIGVLLDEPLTMRSTIWLPTA